MVERAITAGKSIVSLALNTGKSTCFAHCLPWFNSSAFNRVLALVNGESCTQSKEESLRIARCGAGIFKVTKSMNNK